MNLQTAQMVFEEAVDNATREAQGRPTVKLLTYVRSTEPVTIECSEHGIIPDVNYNRARRAKEPCIKCSAITKAKACHKFTDEEYIERFRLVHGDKFTYDMNWDERYRIGVICPEHGTFRVLPSRIITRGQGCPVCRKEDAKVK